MKVYFFYIYMLIHLPFSSLVLWGQMQFLPFALPPSHFNWNLLVHFRLKFIVPFLDLQNPNEPRTKELFFVVGFCCSIGFLFFFIIGIKIGFLIGFSVVFSIIFSISSLFWSSFSFSTGSSFGCLFGSSFDFKIDSSIYVWLSIKNINNKKINNSFIYFIRFIIHKQIIFLLLRIKNYLFFNIKLIIK